MRVLRSADPSVSSRRTALSTAATFSQHASRSAAPSARAFASVDEQRFVDDLSKPVKSNGIRNSKHPLLFLKNTMTLLRVCAVQLVDP